MRESLTSRRLNPQPPDNFSIVHVCEMNGVCLAGEDSRPCNPDSVGWNRNENGGQVDWWRRADCVTQEMRRRTRGLVEEGSGLSVCLSVCLSPVPAASVIVLSSTKVIDLEILEDQFTSPCPCPWTAKSLKLFQGLRILQTVRYVWSRDVHKFCYRHREWGYGEECLTYWCQILLTDVSK